MRSNARVYRSPRRYWWLRPAVLLPALFLVLLAVPVLLWIHTYGSLAADIMFIITYLSLTLWFVYFMKGNLLEPHIKVHAKALKEKKDELAVDRKRQRKEVYAHEIRLLERGETTPVLAVWSMDPALGAKHPFVGMFRVCRIDPIDREFQILIYLDEPWELAENSDQDARFRKLFSSFMTFLSNQPDVAALRRFFDVYVVEVCKLIDDGGLTGRPLPIMSYMCAKSEVSQWIKQAGKLPGDVRYRKGEPIDPHRGIEAL